MKIVIATDSFKGSLDTGEAARAMREGLLRVWPQAEYDCIPVADGGEGTVRALVQGTGGSLRTRRVRGPLGEPVCAEYGILPGGGAVIEMAAAAGLPLLGERRDVLRADTFGVGELILAALADGAMDIRIGLGGSASNDGGAGCLRALGVRFLDGDGRELPPGGGALDALRAVDVSGLDARLSRVRVTLMSDVDSPLCGPRGASAVFGPQKGADEAQVAYLDGCLARYADLLEQATGRRAADIPGAGAAGGLGFGLLSALDARIVPGIEAVLDAVHFDSRVQGASLVVTGEGRIDGQSAQGKAPVGVARRAARAGVMTVAIAGSIGTDIEGLYAQGIRGLFSAVCRPMPLEEAMRNAPRLIADAAERAGRTVAGLIKFS